MEEAEDGAGFVERDTQVVSQMGDRDDDLPAEFASTYDTGDLAIPVFGPAIHFVSDQHRSTIFQPPHQPGVRQRALFRRHALGVDRFGSRDEFHFVVVSSSSPFGLVLLLGVLRVLTLLFRPQGIGLVDSGRRRASELLLQFLDAVLGSPELLLGFLKLRLSGLELLQRVGKKAEQTRQINPSLNKIALELFESVHANQHRIPYGYSSQ